MIKIGICKTFLNDTHRNLQDTSKEDYVRIEKLMNKLRKFLRQHDQQELRYALLCGIFLNNDTFNSFFPE